MCVLVAESLAFTDFVSFEVDQVTKLCTNAVYTLYTYACCSSIILIVRGLQFEACSNNDTQ